MPPNKPQSPFPQHPVNSQTTEEYYRWLESQQYSLNNVPYHFPSANYLVSGPSESSGSSEFTKYKPHRSPNAPISNHPVNLHSTPEHHRRFLDMPANIRPIPEYQKHRKPKQNIKPNTPDDSENSGASGSQHHE